MPRSATAGLWVIVGLVFKKLPIDFLRVAVTFYIPSIVWLIQFLHIFPSIWCCHSFFILAIIIGIWWYVVVTLVYISLKANDIQHLFMSLFNISVFTSATCLVMIFPIFFYYSVWYFTVELEELDLVCCGLNCVSLKCVCWSPNSKYLRM